MSSSNSEHESALAKAREIRDGLSSLGWPKPVLTDSANVIKSPGSDIAGLSQAQDKLRSIPLGVTDPKALCEALEYQVERTISGTVFTLAEIPLPGGGSIPLTVDVATLVGALGGGS